MVGSIPPGDANETSGPVSLGGTQSAKLPSAVRFCAGPPTWGVIGYQLIHPAFNRDNRGQHSVTPLSEIDSGCSATEARPAGGRKGAGSTPASPTKRFCEHARPKRPYTQTCWFESNDGHLWPSSLTGKGNRLWICQNLVASSLGHVPDFVNRARPIRPYTQKSGFDSHRIRLWMRKPKGRAPDCPSDKKRSWLSHSSAFQVLFFGLPARTGPTRKSSSM